MIKVTSVYETTTTTNGVELNQLETNIAKPSSTSPIDIEINGTVTNDDNDLIPSPFTSTIQTEKINNNEQKISENSSEYFYDFQPENFHAEEVRLSFSII